MNRSSRVLRPFYKHNAPASGFLIAKTAAKKTARRRTHVPYPPTRTFPPGFQPSSPQQSISSQKAGIFPFKTPAHSASTPFYLCSEVSTEFPWLIQAPVAPPICQINYLDLFSPHLQVQSSAHHRSHCISEFDPSKQVEMVYSNHHPRHSHSIPKPSSIPTRSAVLHSANQNSSRDPDPARAEANWVAFPPLPEAALHSFSSAVQFVSTTLKPLTEPSIAYPSGPLPNHLSRANNLLSSSSSRLNSLSASHGPASLNANGGLKRSRTTTTSTIPASMSRKRSKSDFGSTSYRPGSSQQLSHEINRNVISSGHTPGFGSSTSLTHLNAPRSTRHRSRTPDPHTPALLIRQKQRLSDVPNEVSARRNNSNSSPYPQYMSGAGRSSSSIRSSASVTSIGTLYPSRSRAHSQLNPITSESQEDVKQQGPVRKTYLGGVGVYLNNTPSDDENSQDEGDSPRGSSIRNSKAKPNLTINVDLCNDGSKSSKSSGNWYNRLLLSPLSSAGSSVYSFIVSSASPLVTPGDFEGLEDQVGPSEKELTASASDSKPGNAWKPSFRRHK
ncbi:hypothetical protein MJO29_011343 [Puccinia striiformis f. sp. tritici]|uniref:Uncharacterized protein n=1 Tax=Puccinia striiformis TaxID=27350 RepID=A0A2S4WJI9_9BASI|nr:hypothetical protein MJO29_011343 [Puccinia striiformis f. sp. tritici]POW21914.1 hypothetical protein PSHT_01892 [Puccinia striiformis]